MGKVSGKGELHFKRGAAMPRMRDVAKRIITDEGMAGLSLRALARDKELRVSHSAPLYHFGTIAGLLGAIAEQEFGELTRRLKKYRLGASPGVDTLVGMAQRYAQFSLGNPNLHQAIHSMELWNASAGTNESSDTRLDNSSSASQRRAVPLIAKAVDARDEAFAEFVEAAKSIIPSDNDEQLPEPREVARMVTTIVDGYLFQQINERVASRNPRKEVGSLVRLALQGVS